MQTVIVCNRKQKPAPKYGYTAGRHTINNLELNTIVHQTVKTTTYVSLLRMMWHEPGSGNLEEVGMFSTFTDAQNAAARIILRNAGDSVSGNTPNEIIAEAVADGLFAVQIDSVDIYQSTEWETGEQKAS